MKHLILTVAFLIAALLLYAFGLDKGSSLLLARGACFELAFWVRALRRKPQA